MEGSSGHSVCEFVFIGMCVSFLQIQFCRRTHPLSNFSLIAVALSGAYVRVCEIGRQLKALVVVVVRASVHG